MEFLKDLNPRKNPYLKVMLPLGFLVFLIYFVLRGIAFSLFLIGPPLYAAYIVKSRLASILSGIGLNISSWNNEFFFLLPITIVYFSLIGFHISQLRKEKNWIRTLGLIGTIFFVLYLHYMAWSALSSYYTQVNYEHILR